MGGNLSVETPHCFASRVTRRGLGWWVAKAPTEEREIPLRSSTVARTFSMRVMAARESASPSNVTSRPPSFTPLT